MPSYIRTRTEFAVNSFTSENQTVPSVSTFADGGFVVTWVTTDPTQDGDSNAIKAQLFDSAGSKVGTEFLVNSVATGGQVSPSVTTFANGNFVVTWGTNTLADGTRLVEAQLFSRNGDKIGSEFQVTTGTSLFEPNVTALADGRFIISWDDWTSQSVKGQIFDSAGARIGGVLTLATDPAQGYGDVIALANGGFVATWRINGTSWDVKAQVFDASGAKVGGAFIVNTTLTGSQNSPDGTALADGGFVITWTESNPEYSSGNTRIKAQMFTASGAKVGGELLVSTSGAYTMGGQVVTALPDGGFIIAWHNTDLVAGGGSDSEVKAQRFSASGAKVDAEFQINTLTTGSQWLPDLDTLADGRVVAVWASGSGDGSGGSIRAQILGTEAAEPLPNTRPVVISDGGGTSATLTRDEGETAVTTVVASDDGEPTDLRYSITGGADAALFTINALTGALAFRQAPDHEAPQDEGADNFYNVTVTASDGILTSFQSIQIAIQHVNRITIVSDGGYDYADVSVDENQTAVTVVSAMDEDGVPLTYSITGGYDAALFTIDPQTGELRFAVAPDYEAPTTMYGGNQYYVQVTASDGTRSDTQDIYVHVNDVEEPQGFAIISDGGEQYAELHLPENSLAVTTVRVSGAAGPVTYEIVGGVSANWFDIDPETGVLSFRGPPDFETGPYGPGSWWYDPYNDPFPYGVIVRASDGVSSDEQEIIITIDDVDEAPVFESFYGEGHVTMIVTENDVDLGYVWASDPDRYSWVTYGLEGADAAFFQVDPYSGAFSFIQAPDYEAWADAGADNVYEVSVVAYSGMLSSSQSFSFTVVDLWENESPTIVSNGGGTSASVDMDERQTFVTTVVAVDDGGPNPVHYSITGGWAASLFAIDPVSGELFFREAPDFENPAAGSDNVYSVEVTADDGELWTSQLIQVTVNNVYEGVRFDSPSSAFSIDENLVTVGAVSARGEPGVELIYSIMASGDGALFQIDGATGEISFRSAPDYENAQDYGWDNVYNITVSVTDGTSSHVQSVSVTVGQVDEPVEIVSYGGAESVSLSIPEAGYWHIGFVAAEDDESDFGNPIVYSITGGADAALFTVDRYSGELRFDYDRAPDFENPSDSDGDNVYEVVVTAASATSTDSQAFAVTLLNRNEGIWITSNGDSWPATVRMGENGHAVTTVTARDPDGTVPTFLIVGGADAARFTIDAQTGALSFIDAPDFESPADAGADNVYNVIVAASDGEETDEQELRVIVENADDAVEIVSYGGAANVTLTADENGVAVGDVLAQDGDGGPVTYSIAGGADASLFAIDSATGALSFVSAPNFESPADADGDNDYDVIVRASDGTSTDDQHFTVEVRNVDEAPEFVGYPGGGTAPLSLTENGGHVADLLAYDPDAGSDPIHYVIVGGADRDLFRIDSQTGRLSLANPAGLDFEAPTDIGRDNVYDVEVMAGSGGLGRIQAFAVTVVNANEPVTILSPAAITVTEGEETYVTRVAGYDVDGTFPTYSIVGGADAARFTLDTATGVLRFVAMPDFEAPTDLGGDNVYTVEVAASDGEFTTTQTMQITVRNVAERVAITSHGGAENVTLNLPENGTPVATVQAVDPDGNRIAYSLTGEDSALFAIDAETGALSFIGSLNFEAPADFDGNNSYLVTVVASDGTSTDTQAFRINIGNVDEAAAITSNGGGATAAVSIGENGLGVTKVVAVDPEGAQVTYAIAGGADAARFTIDAATGALAFVAAPDFEAPADSGADNVYDVVVSASDGTSTDSQALAVTVTNANEAPAITSNGGGATAYLSVGENGRTVTAVAAADPDGTAASYSIVGGADAARFTINPQTGLLEFVAAPDWETPADANGDNIYNVVVQASDGQLADQQSLNISVANVRDGATVTGTTGGDSISGTSTNPALRTTNAEDNVSGRDGHDTILGLGGDDWINGDAGNDSITGGGGADRLTGGLGKDQFVYNATSESTPGARDVITDFSRAQGDRISLSGIDANSLVANNQAFTFIGAAAFSGVAGQLRYSTSGGVTLVSGDVNGDGIADFQIELTGTLTPVASDFVL